MRERYEAGSKTADLSKREEQRVERRLEPLASEVAHGQDDHSVVATNEMLS